MSTIDTIKQNIKSEMELFTEVFNSAFGADEQLLKKVLNHVKGHSGKQLRPIITILCAKLCGTPNINTYRVAAAYEILHTASLIHDDVVDDTMIRRGQPSGKALFDNKVSVLVGDYLLTKSMEFISATNNTQLYKNLSLIGSTLTRGELLQIQHSYTTPTEEDYIDIIRKKTAILFSVCATSGAITTDATPKQLETLQSFADNLGICFQIKDDIFDYSPNAKIGKPTLNDIKEGKITLPLLHSIEQLSQEESNQLFETIKQGNFTEEFFYNIGAFVARNGGIEYSYSTIEKYRIKALEALEYFEDNDTKQALITVLNYIVNREY